MIADSPTKEAASATRQQSGGGKLRSARLFWLFAGIALIAWSCLQFPTGTLNELPDPSWSGVLVHAHEKGWQFGRDVIFTYGPLGFLSIDCFSPDVAVARIVFEIILGLGIATGLCLVTWRTPVLWRFLLLGFFICVTAPLHLGGSALYMDLGLFVWGLLCFLESGPRLRVFAAALVLLAATGALIKFNFLVMGTLTIGLVAFDLVLRGRRATAAVIVSGTGIAFVLGWMMLGQKLSGLATYFSTSYRMAAGYNAAMDQYFANVPLIFVIAAAALAAAIIRSAPIAAVGPKSNGAFRRGLLVSWIAALLFLNWKSICVRADYYHLRLLFGFMPLVALCVQALPSAGKRALLWSRVTAVVCLLVCAVIIRAQIHRDFFPFKGISQARRELSANFGVLWNPARYLRERTEAFQAEQKLEQLPRIRTTLGQGTVDVFGQKQTCALANELNYTPRPVFQSYAAFCQPLMESNERFYLSSNAPDYVLLNLDPIDGRFPPLEDSLVFRDLLFNYKLLFEDGDFLLLQRLSHDKPRLTLVKEGIVREGKKIDLSDQPGANLWLEIEIKPTAMDRLLQVLYKPGEVRLVAQRQSGTGPKDKFSAPAAMLSAGFLASPLLLDNKEVVKFFTGEQIFPADGYTLEFARTPIKFLQPQIHFRLYRIENKLSPRASLAWSHRHFRIAPPPARLTQAIVSLRLLNKKLPVFNRRFAFDGLDF